MSPTVKSRGSGFRNAQRIASMVLVVVVAFVTLVTVTLIVRSRAGRVERARPAIDKADLRIKEAELEEVSGGVRWRLRADQALVFQEEGRTALRGISVKVFDRDRTWTITGDEGDLYQRTSNVEIRQNVVLTSSDGVRLETSVLRWQGAEKRLWTDAPVRMSREGGVADGTALDVRMNDETTTMQGRVHATFTKVRGR